MEFTRHHRTPVPSVADGEIAVQAPPEVPRVVPTNPLARLLPVAMIVAAGGMMVLFLTSGASSSRSPMYLLFPVMMLVSLIGTLAFGARGATRTAELDHGRREYLRYLDGVDRVAADAARTQHDSLHWSHPRPGALWTLVGGPRMWERRPTDGDFGHVRVGVGPRPLCARLVAPDPRPVEEPDPVTAAAVDGLVRRRGVVDAVPLVVAVPRFDMVCVDGDPAAARGLLRSMLCQLAVWHGPDDLAIAAVVDDSVRSEWDWLKWLPHHQDPRQVDGAGSARMVYDSVADAERSLVRSTGVARVVIVLDGAAVAPGVRWGASGDAPGVTVITVGSAAAVTGETVHVGVDDATVTVTGGSDDLHGQPDRMTPAEAMACARRIAPYRPGAAVGDDHRPRAADWTDLIGIRDCARMMPADTWRHRGAGDQLRVPIGVSTDGAPVLLDIKEAAQHGMGPHGLCIGATGSGKSEFLRTLTLGMLATHSPDRLNMILIDFKGGATFLGLDRAPHVCAVITNLADEAHLVARMRDALAGEVNRRQEALRAAGNFADVADYHRARTDRPDLPPLPSLLIVVDEFSELLSQHPDFAELFVAIGRLGRSLGIHLLLASQRLDEGRLRGLDTHLSYRVCLKTFSVSESRAVLGVPDAHHLPGTPGAAYLKTVAGALTRFQTAYVSGPYTTPRPTGVPAPPTRVATLFTAAPVPPPTVRSGPPPATRDRSLLDTVLDRLAGHGPPAHQVWLPPLRHSPPLDALLALGRHEPLTVPIGLVDSPFEQRRDPLLATLAGAAGNIAVVGGPRCGKSTTLRTVALALASTHDPRDVQIYCLDFGGGALASLAELPHVGSVAGRHEGDLVRRTVAELESLVRAREIRFREWGIDSVSEFRRRRAMGDPAVAEDAFGDVFLVVDGWAALRQDFDGLEAAVTALAAHGLSYGVHVAVAASRWAEIRPGLKDQLGTRIELRLGDPAESEMDRKRARLLHDCPPGRGITRDGKDTAIALPRLDGVPAAVGSAEALAAAAAQLRVRHSGRQAPRIRLLPSRVDRDALASDAGSGSPTQIVIGLGERHLTPLAADFGEQPHLIVLGDAECGKTATLRALCAEIVRTTDAQAAQLVIVDYRRTLLGVVETAHLGGYLMSADAVTTRLPSLLETLRARMPGDEVTQRQLRTRTWWTGPEIYVVVDDYDLVAGAGANPLTPLLDYLPHAKDVGLHVVIARRSGGAARAMFDPVLANLRDLGCMGLLMSTGPDEGALFGIRPSVLPPGRGTLVTRGAGAQLVQVAWTEMP